ncbi:hypothetical protein E3P92_02159 [Wallemia ichthyophaga]|uniref:Urea active transporter 1 n=1 Tax=Wallemia ichthyophaga TaxID=245174 RepID=A0A4T0J2H5_WALIC|nr:hypothetical protein E3P91_02157 [Wallemia ichthyophaga]TIA81890.1 hypothetical protein E3P98_01717 [Wallemia ichthyophaga]TIB00010.1 hypothetical protein E3P95_01893 [Wallemia ichthyophaga]TIB01253.1 hypothetical protein E3P94_01925 [Wallemia ichthyophaga]TIB12350.1 hypothetical protein E3P90_02123 [Wallemia ichthyophaga]
MAYPSDDASMAIIYVTLGVFLIIGLVISYFVTKTKTDFLAAAKTANSGVIMCNFAAQGLGAGLQLTYPEIATYGLQPLITYSLAASLPLLTFPPLASQLRKKCPEGFILTEFIRARFGVPAGLFLSTFTIITLYVFMLSEMTSIHSVIQSLTGWSSETQNVWLIMPIVVEMLVTMMYTAWGGFKVSLVTDTIQASFFIILVVVCTIAVAVNVEIDTDLIHQRSDLLKDSQLGWQLLYILPVAVVFNNYFLSSYWQRCYAAKSQKDLTIGCILAACLIFCLTFLVGFSGLIASWSNVYPGPNNVNEDSSSTVLFLLVNRFCPAWINGLMMVLSVALSCAAYDTLQTALVATVSNDIFRNKINVWWTRLILIVNAAVIGPVASNKVNDVLILYLIADLVSAAIMPAMLLGFTDRLYFLNGFDVIIGGLGGILTVFLFGLVYYNGDASSAGALLIINEGLYPSYNSFEALGTFIAAPVGSILWTIAAFGVRVLYMYIRSKITGAEFSVFEKPKPLDPAVVAGNEQMLRPSLSDREAESANNNLRHRGAGRRENNSDSSEDDKR